MNCTPDFSVTSGRPLAMTAIDQTAGDRVEIRPRPPNSDVPPMTAAPTAYSSVCAPPVVGRDRVVARGQQDARDDRQRRADDEAGRLDPATLMPARRAASALPPTAYTCRPKPVRVSSEGQRDDEHRDQRDDPRHALDDDRRVGPLALLVEQEHGHEHEHDREPETFAAHSDSAAVGRPALPAALDGQERRGARSPPTTSDREQPAEARPACSCSSRRGQRSSRIGIVPPSPMISSTRPAAPGRRPA